MSIYQTINTLGKTINKWPEVHCYLTGMIDWGNSADTHPQVKVGRDYIFVIISRKVNTFLDSPSDLILRQVVQPNKCKNE